MTLFDAKPPRPPGGIRKYVPLPLLILVILLAALLGSLLAYRYRNYREERAVARFLDTLEKGDYREAYRLWQPSPSYTFGDFMNGWGEKGDYGSIREFEILGSKSKGPTAIVTVRINHQDPPLDLLVDRRTLGLAYSIF